MKKSLIILLSCIFALLFCEFVVRYIIGYPILGDNKNFYLKNIAGFGILQWNQPYSKFWNVEGGNKIISRNNYGLPGSDIKSGKKNIALVGNSFIEAAQVEREKIASSVFQNELAITTDYQVINIATSGSDPYSNYFRACFFSKYFTMNYVVLIIESMERTKMYLQRYNNLYDICLPNNFGEEKPKGKIRQIISKISRNLSFFSLIQNYLNKQKLEDEREKRQLNLNRPILDKNGNEKRFLGGLEFILKAYKIRYCNFLVLSLESDSLKNSMLQNICLKNNINYRWYSKIYTPQNQCNGLGHLNERGNKVLGEFLYHSFITTFKTINK